MIFNLHEPSSYQVPILISVPHCGTAFPEEVKDFYDQGLIKTPDDTDWFVDKLYDFAPIMGITLITARYSRWVIDLNRDPGSNPLYDDGRIITDLCPTTSFEGEPLYRSDYDLNDKEIRRRVKAYYQPYHDEIEKRLGELQAKFGKVLLWEAHSIRRVVSAIQPDPFPDLILGDNDGNSADQKLINEALKTLEQSNLQVNHNHPFKGGHITRKFGKPEQGQHALQLEMTKVNYMDDAELKYDTSRASKIQDLLKKVFENLINKMDKL